MQSAAALGADGAGGEGFSPVAALKDMLSGWFMAVPKKKRSGARRGQRTAPKYLRCVSCILSRNLAPVLLLTPSSVFRCPAAAS